MATINTKDLMILYPKAEKKHNDYIVSLELSDDEAWENFHSETDDNGFWKHITCDDIWGLLDYIGKRKQVYRITFTLDGKQHMYPFNIADNFARMLLVNMLFCLYEVGEEITLDGESLKSLYHKIDY